MRSSAAPVAVGSPRPALAAVRPARTCSRSPSYAGRGAECRALDPAQSVENPPGSTSVTSTPKPRTSCARASVSPSSAHFDAWYAPIIGNAAMPPIVEICTM